jgi:hypothetical protein
LNAATRRRVAAASRHPVGEGLLSIAAHPAEDDSVRSRWWRERISFVDHVQRRNASLVDEVLGLEIRDIQGRLQCHLVLSRSTGRCGERVVALHQVACGHCFDENGRVIAILPQVASSKPARQFKQSSVPDGKGA